MAEPPSSRSLLVEHWRHRTYCSEDQVQEMAKLGSTYRAGSPSQRVDTGHRVINGSHRPKGEVRGVEVVACYPTFAVAHLERKLPSSFDGPLLTTITEVHLGKGIPHRVQGVAMESGNNGDGAYLAGALAFVVVGTSAVLATE